MYIGTTPQCNHTGYYIHHDILLLFYNKKEKFIPRRIYLRDIQMMAELIHESDIAGGNELGKITGVEAFRVLQQKKKNFCVLILR